MLVPYEPAAQRRAARGFDEYLRSGGRANPIPISTGRGVGGPRDLEGQLLGERSMRKGKDEEDNLTRQILRTSANQARLTQCAVLVALLLLILLFVCFAYLAARANDCFNAAREMIQPHASMIVNTTVDALKDMGGSMTNVRTITGTAAAVVKEDLGPGGAAGRTLNSTAVIAQRLAEFMDHPTLQLSLGGTR